MSEIVVFLTLFAVYPLTFLLGYSLGDYRAERPPERELMDLRHNIRVLQQRNEELQRKYAAAQMRLGVNND